MSHLTPLLAPNASREVQDVYEDFRTRMNFPAAPNFILTQGHSFALARGTWDLVRNVLVGGALPRWMREIIFVAISLHRDCRYCAAAHIACCRMLGVHPDLLDGLVRNIDTIGDPKLAAIVRFSVKCADNPQSLTEVDYLALREHGLGEKEIAEVIGMSALAVYANIIADATGMEPDAMFSEL